MQVINPFKEIACKPLLYLAEWDVEYLTQLEEKGWTQLSVYPEYPKAFGLEGSVDELEQQKYISLLDVNCESLA